MTRFNRQLNLKGFGASGQKKLKAAHVLVVGAGGLGCPVLNYLAAAGVGKISVIDGDVVEISNLNRQIIFGESDVGKNKALSAADYLTTKYSDLEVVAIPEYITSLNALLHISTCNVVIDGSDNFPTRYLVNDACVLLNKPFVSGAVYEYEGQVGVFNVQQGDFRSTNYRDVYPEPPGLGEAKNCSDAGVIGVLPGVIGTLLAAEAIKIISGIGNILMNKMLYYNFINQSFYDVETFPDEDGIKLIPATREDFVKRDYDVTCGSVNLVDWDEVFRIKNYAGEKAMLVDIRELEEISSEMECVRIPYTSIMENTEFPNKAETLFVFCQSGVRSIKAARLLIERYPGKKIYSVRGGLNRIPKKNKISLYGT